MSTDATPGTVHRLREVTLVLQRHGEEFASRNGLGANDVRALIHLLDHERSGTPASPTVLARDLGVTTASTTALLDRLERAGYVYREQRSDDRRRLDIRVTESAKQVGWAFFGPLIAATTSVLETRSAAERAVIDGVLDDLVRALAAVPPAGDGQSVR